MFDFANDRFFARSVTEARIAPRLGAALLSAWRRVLVEIDVAADRGQLHRLSDHLLRDVGLERDQIDNAVRRGARRNAGGLERLPQ